MNVLVVEDEMDIARLIVFILKEEGFTVERVLDTGEAEETLDENDYDLILLDLMLPGEDGFSFCRRLKGAEETRDIPIIIISARAMPAHTTSWATSTRRRPAGRTGPPTTT